MGKVFKVIVVTKFFIKMAISNIFLLFSVKQRWVFSQDYNLIESIIAPSR